jgi:FAD/FMN-containing dehydrogenase
MIHEHVSSAEYNEKEAGAVRQFMTLLSLGKKISIKKNARHIFKDRDQKPNLDLRHFNQVLSIDTENNIATVEGMTTYYDLVGATLVFNLMPQAVPELRSITVGGAIAGLGGQSSSFKYGLVHEMVTDFDLLTGEGKVIHCSPLSNSDIYYMLPNSYGSLGYVLKCNIKLKNIAPYVKLSYLRYSEAAEFFEAMISGVESCQADFVEGVSFSPSKYILLIGNFTDKLPRTEKCLVPLHEPLFRSIRDPGVSFRHLTIYDYIWRWDPDVFWATDQKNLIGLVLLNPIFRRTLGRYLLRSDRLVNIGKFRNRLRKKGAAKYVFLEARRREALIQDAAIPFESAPEFDAWLAKELQIYPLWYCPVKTTKPIGTYPLYRPESECVLDFGFYTSIELEDHMEPYFYNKQIENKLVELGGIKCLYSDTFFSKDQFWSIYDKHAYKKVKAKYDPQNAFLDLYQKVINKLD